MSHTKKIQKNTKVLCLTILTVFLEKCSIFKEPALTYVQFNLITDIRNNYSIIL